MGSPQGASTQTPCNATIRQRSVKGARSPGRRDLSRSSAASSAEAHSVLDSTRAMEPLSQSSHDANVDAAAAAAAAAGCLSPGVHEEREGAQGQ